jgi:hypothetical protein
MDSQDQAKRTLELSRSSQAKQILENSIFQESIDTLKKNYRDALFEQTGVNDNIAREKLWLAYQVLGKVENHFKEILETGKLAEKQLADFQKQDKKF